MRHIVLVLLMLVVIGCGESGKNVPVPISEIPEPLMTIAHEKLPGVTFQQALLRADGIYEITGKDGRGKVREIELTEAGEVVEIE